MLIWICTVSAWNCEYLYTETYGIYESPSRQRIIKIYCSESDESTRGYSSAMGLLRKLWLHLPKTVRRSRINISFDYTGIRMMWSFVGILKLVSFLPTRRLVFLDRLFPLFSKTPKRRTVQDLPHVHSILLLFAPLCELVSLLVSRAVTCW